GAPKARPRPSPLTWRHRRIEGSTPTKRRARRLTRRDVMKSAAAAAALLPMPALAQGAAGRVVVIGGGFAGASCARALKVLDARINVTLVEASRTLTA